MDIPRRIRTIAVSQMSVIKERLARIEAEAEAELARRGMDRRAAEEELDALPGDEIPAPPPTMPTTRQPSHARTPSEIAPPAQRPIPPSTIASPASTLSIHYRVLGLAEGADLIEVERVYKELAARCSPSRFEAGSTEAADAAAIMVRVEAAYTRLREALDPTAGRFDKLEL